MIKVATVQYLNALPFLYSLRQLKETVGLEIVEATPYDCAKLLADNKVDIALLPVGAMEDFEELFLITDYCIGCNGPVRSVKIFSNVPITEVQQILLDSNSRSSNLLVHVLCKYHWGLDSVSLVTAPSQLADLATGKLVIGDGVFEIEGAYQYEYDLGLEWKKFTGLPFVFACWVSKTKQEQNMIDVLNTSFEKNIQLLPVSILEEVKLLDKNLLSYFQDNISYNFDAEKRMGMQRFLELIGNKSKLIAN